MRFNLQNIILEWYGRNFNIVIFNPIFYIPITIIILQKQVCPKK